MDVCLILFRRKLKPVVPDRGRDFLTTSWDESMKLMSEAGFLSKILRYPTDTMNEEMIDLLIPYLRNP